MAFKQVDGIAAFKPIPGRMVMSPEEMAQYVEDDDTEMYAAITIDDLLVYVDPVLGNDTNSGLDIAHPVKTLDYALTNIPAMWTKKCRIYLATGTYTTALSGLSFIGPAGSLAEPLFIIGPMVDAGPGPMTCAAGSTGATLNVATALTADALYGARIRFTSGANAGKTFGCVGNTTSAISVWPSAAAPSLGDAFVVERPGATVEYSKSLKFIFGTSQAGVSGGFNQRMPSIAMYGVKWKNTTAANLVFTGGGTHAWLDSCEFDYNGLAGANMGAQYGARLDLCTFASKWPDISNSSPTPNVGHTYIHGGVGTYGGNALVGQLYALIPHATIIGDGINVSTSVLGYTTLIYPFLRRGYFWADDGSVMTIQGQAQFDGGGTLPGCIVARGAVLDGINAGIALSNFVGDALTVDGARTANLTAITGTGNTGYGVRIKAGTSMVLPAGSTVTGTLGDIMVGGTASTHANLTAATFVTDANYLARVSRT